MTAEEPKKGYGPLAAVSIVVGIYFLSQLVVGIVFLLTIRLLGLSQDEASPWIEGSTVGQFCFGLVSAITTLGTLSLFLRRRHISLATLGLVRPKWRDVALSLGGFVAYFFGVAVVMTLLPLVWPGLDVNQQQDVGFAMATGWPALILVFISLVIIPPIVEETLVRGFLYTNLRPKLSFISSAFVVSALFGIAHLQFNDGESPLWIAVVDTFVLSMVLVTLRERAGSLWPAIGVHLVKNGLAFCFLFVF